MKKTILSLLFLTVLINAKQFAYCGTKVGLHPTEFDFCTKETSKGSKFLKIDSIGKMYANGWRLITVSNFISDGSVSAYFYFEK